MNNDHIWSNICSTVINLPHNNNKRCACYSCVRPCIVHFVSNPLSHNKHNIHLTSQSSAASSINNTPNSAAQWAAHWATRTHVLRSASLPSPSSSSSSRSRRPTGWSPTANWSIRNSSIWVSISTNIIGRGVSFAVLRRRVCIIFACCVHF